MATKVVPGGFWLPAPYYSVGFGIPALDAVALTAAAHKAAFAIRVPRTGTLNRVGWRTGTVTNNPDNGMRTSFQNLDASGNPDGVQDQFRDIAGPFSATTWYTTGLMTSDGTDTGTKRSVTAGDRIAVVVEFVSFVAGDSIQIAAHQALLNDGTAPLLLEHYTDGFVAAWTKTRSHPLLALEYVTDGWVPLTDFSFPVLAFTNIATTGGGSPERAALRFKLSFDGWCDGAWIRLDCTGDQTVELFDGDGSTVLASTTIDDSALFSGNGTQIFVRWAPVQLVAGVAYRLSVRPATGVTVHGFTVDSAALMDAVVGGIEWYKSLQNAGSGVWTDTTTERPLMGLHFSAIDEGGAGAVALVSTQCPSIVFPMGVVGY